MLITLLLLFVILVAFSMPFAFAIGISSLIAMLFFGEIPITGLTHKLVNGINSFVFLAIPLFLLAGRLMNAGGITDRLFHFARVLVGHIHGGLAHANVVAGMMFAWMSGSAVAAVGGLGAIEVKAMKDQGYDVPFAASVATAASTLGPIIPPSIPMIIYGAMTEVSVGKLFLGGIVPGLILAFLLMFLIFIISYLRDYPRDRRASAREIWTAFKSAIIPLLMPVIILGGIGSGIFTPTEAAAIAVAYTLIVSMLYYRTIRPSDLPQIFVETMITTSVVTFIISMTSAFSYLLAIESAGERISSFLLGFTENKYIILFLVNIMLLILGSVMEAGVVLILFTPILLPIMLHIGVDPVHFGVIMVVNLMFGVATPPVGMCLFVMSNISGVRLETLMRAILPFLIPMLITLLIITYWPAIVLFLPSLLK